MQKINISDAGIISSAVLLAIAVRILVISSSPAFILGGDTPGYVAYVHEILSNGNIVPWTNSIHFPGSIWVYPPLLPYLWSSLDRLFGTSPLAPFYIIESSGMVIDSLVIVPLFLTANMIFGKKVATVSAFLYTVYLPDLYALTWGGVPQLFATFLMAWVLYFTVRISRVEGSPLKNAIWLGAVLSVLVFTHDLTIFVMLFVLILTVIISAILLKVNLKWVSPDMSHLRSIIRHVPLALILSVPALLIWYGPRYWWIIDAGAPYINSSLPQVFSQSATIPQLVYQGLDGYLSPLGFAIFLIPLLLYSIYVCIKDKPEKSGILLLFLLFPIVMSILDFHDPTIVARMGYYSFLPSMIMVSYGIMTLFQKSAELRRKSVHELTGQRGRRRTIAAAVAVPIILVSAMGVTANMYSHTFYNSYLSETPPHVIDYSTLKWIHSNLPRNSTFASFGELGYYIMGYDGNPTLVYQNLKYLTQPVEWNESIAAYNLIYRADVNAHHTQQIISQYNISYVTVMNNAPVPSFYQEVYTNSNLTIYYVRG